MSANAKAGPSSVFDQWDPLHEHYISEVNTLGMDATADPCAALRGYKSLLNDDYCQHYAKYGTCMDKQYCRKKHLGPNSEELNAEKEFVFCESMIRRDYFPPNAAHLLFADVTFIDRPNNFQVMLPFGRKDFRHYRRRDLRQFAEKKTTDSPAKFVLEQCHNELQSLYGKNYRRDNINIAPAIAQLVAVQLANGSFLRAVVTDINYDEQLVDCYEVKLIDTGCIYVLPRERIHPFPARFLNVNPQSIPCRLPLTAPRDPSYPKENLVKGWPKESMNKFVEFCSAKTLLIRIFSYNDMDGVYTVDLYNFDTKTSLIDMMLEKELAERLIYGYQDYAWPTRFSDNFDNNGFV